MKVGSPANSRWLRFVPVAVILLCVLLVPTGCDNFVNPSDLEPSGSLINCTGTGQSVNSINECNAVMLNTNNCREASWNSTAGQCIGTSCLSCVLP